jgi:ATP-dependent protease HslVU (ClpYQ) peptidase subunit
MTTILAVQHEDKVVFGADSQTTATTGKRYTHPHMTKLTEKGHYIVACAGDVAACDIVHYLWTPPNPKVTDWENTYVFVVTRVVPSLKECFKTHEYKWQNDKDDEGGFTILLAVGGTVFEIDDDMSVSLDVGGLYGVGSGSDFGIGALASGATLKKALSISAKFDVYTAAPFIFKTQEKRRVINHINK